jgi:hypothetical protein
MINLPQTPQRIQRLPKDDRGYPVPAFVEWLIDGKKAPRGYLGAKPDFRYADGEFRARAFRTGLCWVCGEKLGVHKVYAIGPMCVINRTTSEPACHRDCAEFSVKACPFLLRPRQKRNAKGLEEDATAPGTMITRNPGCLCLYETNEASAFSDSQGGWLIRLGKPDRVDWWAEGRQATRAEIQASIDGGFPLLMDMAMDEGQEAVDELTRLTHAAFKLLPAA